MFSKLVEFVKGVPERIQALQLIHFYKADPGYRRGVARKLCLDKEKYYPWTNLSLKELAENTAE